MTSGDLGVVVAWLATYGAHSAVLLGTAWLITRRVVQSHQTRDLIWKVVLAGGIVSATMQQVIAREPWAGRFEIAQADERMSGWADGGINVAPVSPATGIVQPRLTTGEPLSRSTAQPPVAARPATIPRTDAFFWTWLAIAAALVLHFVLRRVGLSARFGPRELVEDAGVLSVVNRLKKEAGIRRGILVTQAPNLASPVALGMSEICLPEAALELEPEQQLSMLAHEVAHLARRDPAWLMVSCLLERIFFFQPLNHIARRRLQESAEYLCDDWAARRTGSGLTLAKCLVKVAEWIDTTPYPVPVSGMAETRSQFVSRIHRLIANHGLKAEPRRRWLLPFSVAVVGVVVAAAPGARAGGVQLPEEATPEPQQDARTAQSPATSGSWQVRHETKKESLTATATVTNTNTVTAASTETVTSTPWSASSSRWSDVPVPQDTGVVAALLAALRDPDVDVRRAAAQSLGNLRSLRAVPGLLAAMKDEDVEVRAEVLQALGNLRDQRAFDGMLEALKDPSPRIRAHAAEAVSQLMNESIARSKGEQAAAQLALLLSDSSVDVRRHAIQALKDYERARPVEAFLTALRDTDKDVRSAAAEALGQTEDPRGLQPLIGMLQQDKSADVRHQAAHALGHLKDRRAADALAVAVRDANADVRMAAIESLGELELSDAPQALIDAMKDENRDVRQAAANAAAQIGDPKAVPALVVLLRDNDADVRSQAVEALSEIRDTAAINALVAAMQSTDPNVRKRAAQALGERK